MTAFFNEIIHWFDVIIALKMKGKANNLFFAFSLFLPGTFSGPEYQFSHCKKVVWAL